MNDSITLDLACQLVIYVSKGIIIFFSFGFYHFAQRAKKEGTKFRSILRYDEIYKLKLVRLKKFRLCLKA